jgi:hypothetical protein
MKKRPNYIKTIILCFSFLVSLNAKSQSFLGLGFGTFNIPGANEFRFRGTGPTLKYEYITRNERSSLYADLSYYSKSYTDGNQVNTTYTYYYSQLGFKEFLFDADSHKLIPYLGGGFALLSNKTDASYQGSGSGSFSTSENRFLWGFHSNIGLQYNIKPVIIELRGNLDLILKPLEESSSVSNILTNLRLCVSLPFSKL